MHQGQLCKIQVHTNQDPIYSEGFGKDGGWFMKLRNNSGKTKFYLVDQNRTKEVSIDPQLVDESMRNSDPTKPYYVVCVLPTNIQPLALSVSAKTDAMASKIAIEAKMEELESGRQAAIRNLASAQEKVKYHEKSIEDFAKREDELFKIAAMPDPHFVYIYGKHSADGQEYSWRAPYELYGTIHAGSTVIAETKHGPASVIVTNVEKSAYLIEHKLVISVA